MIGEAAELLLHLVHCSELDLKAVLSGARIVQAVQDPGREPPEQEEHHRDGCGEDQRAEDRRPAAERCAGCGGERGKGGGRRGNPAEELSGVGQVGSFVGDRQAPTGEAPVEGSRGHGGRRRVGDDGSGRHPYLLCAPQPPVPPRGRSPSAKAATSSGATPPYSQSRRAQARSLIDCSRRPIEIARWIAVGRRAPAPARLRRLVPPRKPKMSGGMPRVGGIV